MPSFQIHQISIDCFGIERQDLDLGIRMMDMAFLLMGFDEKRQVINRNHRDKTTALVMSNAHDTITAHSDGKDVIVTVTGNKYTDAFSVQKIVEQSFKPKRIRISHFTRVMANTDQPE